MIPVKVKCEKCNAEIEVGTYRKFVVCPYCDNRFDFEGFDYREINWEDSIFDKVKKWTDCPSCHSPNMYLGVERRGWKCPDCGYIWPERERKHGVLWFCDNCETYLNVQPGFTDKNKTWICTECGFLNDVTKNNIL